MESKMMNEIYLRKDVVQKIRRQFLANAEIPSVHLHDFLDKDFYERVRKELLGLRWKHNVEILDHSYHTALLPKELKILLNDKLLLLLISSIINKKVKKIEASCFSFGWKNYTMLHDLGKERAGIDFIMDFTEDWSADAGGQIVYTENKGDGLVVPALGNSLLLVQRKNMHVRKFLKYVNHHAGKNKRIIVVGKIGV